MIETRNICYNFLRQGGNGIMLTKLELESLYQENRAKSQLIEKVNLHALELQDQITELNRQLVLAKEECSRLREENIQLQEKCRAQLGVKVMAKQFPRSFVKAVLRKMFNHKV